MEQKLSASAKVPSVPFVTPATGGDKRRDSQASSTVKVRDYGVTDIRVYGDSSTKSGAGTTKRRGKGKSVNIVRQPDKQGIERFIDPGYAQKLSDIES